MAFDEAAQSESGRKARMALQVQILTDEDLK
jgi:hypothetical protein